jgi:2-polyprenyl-6-methoxyphenol hydroxylase-like FAD-dependent oxidoreductase
MHVIRKKNLSLRVHKRSSGPGDKVLVISVEKPFCEMNPGLVSNSFEKFQQAIAVEEPELGRYLVEDNTEVSIGSIPEQWVDRYVYGDKVAFVGDSAHGTNPGMGHGVNSALTDVRVLLED